MNPYANTRPPPTLPSNPYDITHNAPLSATSPALIQTGHSSVAFHQASDAGHQLAPPPYSGFVLASRSSLVPVPSPPPPPPPATPFSCQVSVIVPSPDLRPSPPSTRCGEDASPDLECSVCFSQFNNVFRCPKMLQCRHTFCLECLARINVKSAEPDAIQCPLCRGLTALPALGLPRLATNRDLLSYLPAAMQRVYSVRFLRSKGKLEVKRSSEGQRRWGQRSLTSLRSANRSLDVGLPSPPAGARGGGAGGPGSEGGLGEALFRLTGRPACRAFLLAAVVMMMALLTGIIIYLLAFPNA
uniref:RING finger protein 223-like n=1 Tax=Gasterosteus aculeatus aculeatus TaxID=481459 RepID=UPI001A97ED75|nr:RING finger protein 223-like [Gasterosteus aculeatus aculeatus]